MQQNSRALMQLTEEELLLVSGGGETGALPPTEVTTLPDLYSNGSHIHLDPFWTHFPSANVIAAINAAVTYPHGNGPGSASSTNSNSTASDPFSIDPGPHLYEAQYQAWLSTHSMPGDPSATLTYDQWLSTLHGGHP